MSFEVNNLYSYIALYVYEVHIGMVSLHMYVTIYTCKHAVLLYLAARVAAMGEIKFSAVSKTVLAVLLLALVEDSFQQSDGWVATVGFLTQQNTDCLSKNYML